MTGAIIALSVAVVALAISTAVLAATIPFLTWKMFRLQGDLEKLDEVVSSFMEGIKINEAIDKTRAEEKGNV